MNLSSGKEGIEVVLSPLKGLIYSLGVVRKFDHVRVNLIFKS